MARSGEEEYIEKLVASFDAIQRAKLPSQASTDTLWYESLIQTTGASPLEPDEKRPTAKSVGDSNSTFVSTSDNHLSATLLQPLNNPSKSKSFPELEQMIMIQSSSVGTTQPLSLSLQDFASGDALDAFVTSSAGTSSVATSEDSLLQPLMSEDTSLFEWLVEPRKRPFSDVGGVQVDQNNSQRFKRDSVTGGGFLNSGLRLQLGLMSQPAERTASALMEDLQQPDLEARFSNLRQQSHRHQTSPIPDSSSSSGSLSFATDRIERDATKRKLRPLTMLARNQLGDAPVSASDVALDLARLSASTSSRSSLFDLQLPAVESPLAEVLILPPQGPAGLPAGARRTRRQTSQSSDPNGSTHQNSSEGTGAENMPVEIPCPYDDCDRTFPTRQKLRSHWRQHKKRREYACDYEGCTMVLFRKQDLERHRVTHLGYKQYSCRSCGVKFSRRDGLSRHLRRTRCGIENGLEIVGLDGGENGGNGESSGKGGRRRGGGRQQSKDKGSAGEMDIKGEDDDDVGSDRNLSPASTISRNLDDDLHRRPSFASTETSASGAWREDSEDFNM
ncbi:hypothetical protein HDU97_003240 [Phlyctochytrium planicorne]|nr:hypothetical protein HDU97_003240 [Phlyctochytrium planicorne]